MAFAKNALLAAGGFKFFHRARKHWLGRQGEVQKSVLQPLALGYGIGTCHYERKYRQHQFPLNRGSGAFE